jgi:uncharacterized membrane protein YoaK (UPF0700 family)
MSDETNNKKHSFLRDWIINTLVVLAVVVGLGGGVILTFWIIAFVHPIVLIVVVFLGMTAYSTMLSRI